MPRAPLRFGADLQVDDNDRPLDPPVIRDAEVVWNPFEDLVPRVDKEAIKAEQEAKAWVGCMGWQGREVGGGRVWGPGGWVGWGWVPGQRWSGVVCCE